MEPLYSADELAVELARLEILPSTDPHEVLAPAATAEAAATRLGRPDLAMWARLIQGDALSQTGDVSSGGRISQEVNRWAADQGHQQLLARSHRVLSWFYYHAGDTAGHLEHAIRALECDDGQSPLRLQYDLTITLAAALSATGSHAESRSRYHAAQEIAVTMGDVSLQLRVLNNLSYGEYWAGNPQAAMDTADRMLSLAARNHKQLYITELDTVARAQMGVGRYAEAEQTLLNLAPTAASERGNRGRVAGTESLLTLVEIQRLLGATDRAWATLELCMRQCEERGLVSVRTRLLQERAELLAADGSYREAFEQHKTFHAAFDALLSTERDMRARALQALFETDEARRDSLRFREMSLRDPLTGLYNRRYVDEQMDALVRKSAGTGLPLSVGLVDLDFFKIVNDTLSHAVGDDVLVQVSRLLMAAVSEPAFAARLGGEEFLLVLPGVGAQEAVARCEAVRMQIRAHDWAELTGEVTITASIGVTTALAGRLARSTMLANADRNLYSAKRTGRDRVVGDPALSIEQSEVPGG